MDRREEIEKTHDGTNERLLLCIRTRLKWEITIKCSCRFEILKACVVRTTIFWDMGLCGLFEKYRILGVTQVAAKKKRITHLKIRQTCFIFWKSPIFIHAQKPSTLINVFNSFIVFLICFKQALCQHTKTAHIHFLLHTFQL